MFDVMLPSMSSHEERGGGGGGYIFCSNVPVQCRAFVDGQKRTWSKVPIMGR